MALHLLFFIFNVLRQSAEKMPSVQSFVATSNLPNICAAVIAFGFIRISLYDCKMYGTVSSTEARNENQNYYAFASPSAWAIFRLMRRVIKLWRQRRGQNRKSSNAGGFYLCCWPICDNAFINVWIHVVLPAPLGPSVMMPWRTFCVSYNWISFNTHGGWNTRPAISACSAMAASNSE